MVQENHLPTAAVNDDATPVGLVVGNYCHDVLHLSGDLATHSLGGAASFISNVLDRALSASFIYVSKVGLDFSYSTPHRPLTSASAPTTLFHAHFDSNSDRVLKLIHACDPIASSDLPSNRYRFGVAAAVAGEIPLETLTRVLDLCETVLVDVQGLIRQFDHVDGTVRLVPLRSTEYYEILPRLGFLKASAEEVQFVELEEVRKWCCLIVTDGEDGCRVYWKDGEVKVPPFSTVQIDPTGAGDSFLGGFVVGIVSGLNVADAALLGNFFGSITVGQIGVPKFDLRMMQKVKHELERKTAGSCWRNVAEGFLTSDMDEGFHAFLTEAAKASCSHCSSKEDDDEDHQHE